MNDMYSGFIGAIIGALIGGVFSYYGAKNSTSNQIKVQTELYNEELNRQKQQEYDLLQKHVALVQVELISWIELSVKRVNRVVKSISKPKQLNHNIDFRNYLNMFITEITFEEAQLIISLYGMIQKISTNLDEFVYTTGNENEISHSCEILVEEIFGEEKLDNYRNIDPNMITRDSLMSELNAKYKNLFAKLNKLSNYNIYIL